MDLQTQIDEINRQLAQLRDTTTIPLEVDGAFRDRFKLSSFAVLKTQSDKSAGAENVTTSAGGGNTVLGAPDGFLVYVSDTGTPYYFPYYT